MSSLSGELRSGDVVEVQPLHIHKQSVDEFAGYQRTIGQKVVCVEGLWWRQVRACFYRPLLPFREFPAASRGIPSSAWLGGVQHVVPCGQPGNSTMSFLIFADAGDYSLDKLPSKPRQQVRWAAKRFTVRPFTDRTEFAEQAFPVYKFFYARTRYRYLAERLHKPNFDKWADAVFEHGPALILGAFRGTELSAVSIAHAVEDTLLYSTVFGTDEALRDHVSDLLLHTVRQAASRDGHITQVYVGMPKPAEDRGIDEFSIRRGCRVVAKPAALWLNPASKLLLGCFFSGQYARMRGEPTVPASAEAETAEDSTTNSGVWADGRGAGS